MKNQNIHQIVYLFRLKVIVNKKKLNRKNSCICRFEREIVVVDLLIMIVVIKLRSTKKQYMRM
jgi:hypothetical protein